MSNAAWNRADYKADPDKWDKRNKAWRDANPEARSAIQERATTTYREKNPKKYRAHYMVNNAIRGGRLHRPNVCEHCGAEQFTEASHTDYDKPLDVEWLCRPCHRRKDSL